MTKEVGTQLEVWPQAYVVDEAIPQRAREFLQQASNSLGAPAGAVILTASAVDSMLKAKGFRDGSLNSRIRQAASQHLITAEMEAWAHEVRLEANDQRHADEEAPLPSMVDAQRVLTFAKALGEFLFVLPLKVQQWRTTSDASPKPAPASRAQVAFTPPPL